MPSETNQRSARLPRAVLHCASCDERRPRVGAEAKAVRGTAGDGEDVLQRAAELGANDVGGGVNAEGLGGQRQLHLLGHLRVESDAPCRRWCHGSRSCDLGVLGEAE